MDKNNGSLAATETKPWKQKFFVLHQFRNVCRCSPMQTIDQLDSLVVLICNAMIIAARLSGIPPPPPLLVTCSWCQQVRTLQQQQLTMHDDATTPQSLLLGRCCSHPVPSRQQSPGWRPSVPHSELESKGGTKPPPPAVSSYCLSLDTVIAADGLLKRSEPEKYFPAQMCFC